MNTEANMTELAEIKTAEIVAPDHFITQAIESKADVSVLSGLFDLKQKHEAAEAKKAFNRAMLQFQTNKPNVTKDREVSYGGGKAAYKYATLSHIESVIKDALEECGLSYRWESVEKDGRDGQRCVVTHVLGHSESNEMYAPNDDSGNKNQVQALGSTTSYLKRYTLIGALGLTTADEDDDGQASSEMPYIKLLEHNEAVRNNLGAIHEVKAGIEQNDYDYAVEILYSMNEETLNALWIAPTKGGIFTTAEIKVIKTSPEWSQARERYFAEKNGDSK